MSMKKIFPSKRGTAVGVTFLTLLVASTESLLAAPAVTFAAPNRQRTSLQSNKEPAEDSSFQVQTWNPLRLAVLKLGMTEPMATSPFNYGEYDGTFSCAYCGKGLFDSNAKYDSKSGWPSFWRSIEDGSVGYKKEMDGRLECRCGRCKSHLGHVFLDGPNPTKVEQDVFSSSPESDPRGKNPNALPRFCVNGASLNFNKRDSS
jgi:peptide-methionine (R)-S-oxide reductase